jgi:DNA invertase Pin-like site-specific DNA recombinase
MSALQMSAFGGKADIPESGTFLSRLIGLGRSLQLVELLGELHSKRVDQCLHQRGIDTSTPAGKALFQMMGVSAEFERAMIRERVNAGLARAKAQGKRLGRRRNDNAN